MVLREVLFGAQKQAAKQMEVVEEFVRNYLQEFYHRELSFDDRDTVDGYIGGALAEIVEQERDIQFPSVFPQDENYVSPEKWFFVRLFLGVDAVNDICEHTDCKYVVDSTTQENGKIVYYASMCENEVGEEVDGGDPVNVDTTEADKIVQQVISYCPPSEREKLPADDKLAAILLSRSYWQGKL